MFEINDFRIQNKSVVPIENGVYNSKEKTFSTESGKVYEVFRDWSLKLK